MKKEEFKSLIAKMNEDRTAYAKVHKTHEPLREFLNEVKREYQSLDDADWIQAGSKEALDDKIRKQTEQFLESYNPADVVQILLPYDVSSVRIDHGYKVVPISSASDAIGSYGLPGAVFLERLAENLKYFFEFRALPDSKREKVTAKMTNSFYYACRCKRENPCESCKMAQTLEALAESSHTAQILLGYFYRQKERAIRTEYPVVEWDKGVSAEIRLNLAFLKEGPNDTLKLLCTQGRNLPKLEHIAYTRKEGFVKATVDLKSENEVDEFYILLETVKERAYSREDARNLRADITGLLEMVHLREYLKTVHREQPLKYAKRGEHADIDGIVDSVEQIVDRARLARAEIDDKIKSSKANLRENYGVLSVSFCCEDNTGHDGPSMFPYVRQGKIDFYGKTITSSNDMKLIKSARDYLLSTKIH